MQWLSSSPCHWRSSIHFVLDITFLATVRAQLVTVEALMRRYATEKMLFITPSFAASTLVDEKEPTLVGLFFNPELVVIQDIRSKYF